MLESQFHLVYRFAPSLPFPQHDLNRFIPLLKRDATLCRVGVGKLTTPSTCPGWTSYFFAVDATPDFTSDKAKATYALSYCVLP
jgi:hypothetical protein